MNKPLRQRYLESKNSRMYKKNQNWIAVVVGAVGSGKTYYALRCAYEMMGNNFDPFHHLIFTIEEFMEKLNNNDFKKGEVIVFEEAGVNISSKDWQSRANKNINFVLQTCRHRNFSIIFTLPMYKFLDNSTRALIHTAFVTNEIDYKKELNYCKVYDFKIDALRDKQAKTIFPKFWVGGVLITMKRLPFKLPPEHVVDVYEDRKLKFTNELNKKIEEEIKIEKKEKEKKAIVCDECIVCGNYSWEYRKKDKYWLCRKCGYENYKNPYEQKQT